jgi:hypothetical protein
MREIISGIAKADLVVADLTTLNANVFYELGLCHGLRIPTILIAQSMDDVPFDLRPYKIQLYDTRFDKIHKLTTALTDIGERHRAGDLVFGSPVVDFFPSVGDSEETESELATDSLEVLGEDTEEKGILDYSAEIETAFDDLTEILTTIGQENEKITSKSEIHRKHFEELNVNPSPGSAAQKQKVGLLMASDMNLCSKRFEEELPRFERAVNTLDEGFNGLMTLAMQAKNEDKQKIGHFREQIAGFLESSEVPITSFRDLRDTVAGLTGISKDVNRASRRLAQALNGIVQNLENIKAFAIRVIALFDQWLDGEAGRIN